MAVEFEVSPKLKSIDAMQSRTKAGIMELNLEQNLGSAILLAAVQAFSAISLIPVSGPLWVSLGKRGWEIRLALAFDTNQAKAPLGLDQALFCPPANRAGYHHKNQRGIWAAFWEI